MSKRDVAVLAAMGGGLTLDACLVHILVYSLYDMSMLLHLQY
ncbi:hypothetical protein [Ehrlichia minasensis]|nr:hypothetical protein [Ehrlichia minasensis]